MEFSPVEIFGYAASVVVAISLMQSSIIRLRWINLLGSSSFCIYGAIIGAYPVALLNGFIALTNVFFLRKILLNTEVNFSLLRVNRPSNYVDFFLDYHKEEIQHLFPKFLDHAHDQKRDYFFLMEDTKVVGMISGYQDESRTFIVDFDFVIPAYRDCKLGHFALGKGGALRNTTDYRAIAATADSVEHEQYLRNLGFTPKHANVWTYDGNG